MKNVLLEREFPSDLTVPAFGYELIREELLQDLLGKNTSQLLYWAGKNLARKYPLETTEEITSFFTQAGWGELHLVSSKKAEMEWHLTGELISRRFVHKDEPSFQLEAGFLAQQIEQQQNKVTETYEQQKKRAQTVIFTVKWDK